MERQPSGRIRRLEQRGQLRSPVKTSGRALVIRVFDSAGFRLTRGMYANGSATATDSQQSRRRATAPPSSQYDASRNRLRRSVVGEGRDSLDSTDLRESF